MVMRNCVTIVVQTYKRRPITPDSSAHWQPTLSTKDKGLGIRFFSAKFETNSLGLIQVHRAPYLAFCPTDDLSC